MMAYDGKVKLDPDRLMRHHPERVEAMLRRLWQLGDGGKRETAEFLRAAVVLASGAEGEGLLLFVTGRNEVGAMDEWEGVPPGAELRVAVLQIGADGPEPAAPT